MFWAPRGEGGGGVDWKKEKEGKNPSPTKPPQARDRKQTQRRWDRYQVNFGENVNEQRTRNNWEECIAIPMYVWRYRRYLSIKGSQGTCLMYATIIIEGSLTATNFSPPTRKPPPFPPFVWRWRKSQLSWSLIPYHQDLRKIFFFRELLKVWEANEWVYPLVKW